MDDVQPIKLSAKDLARAIIDKANLASPYSKLSYWVETKYDYGGIFKQARSVFPEYNKLYPTDEEFSKYFARDYFKKDPKLLEAIFGKKVDQTVAPKQTEVNTPPVKPQPTTPTVPPPPKPVEKRPPLPPEPEEINGKESSKTGFRLQLPKMPANLKSIALNAGSRLSIVVRKYVGQHVTFGRTLAVAGGVAAGIATGGNPLAIAAGAGAGLLGSSYLSSPEGKSFMQNLGRGNTNSSQRNSLLRRSKKSNFRFLKLLLAGGALSFFLLAIFGGFLAPFGGPITPSGKAAPVSTGTTTNLTITLAGPGECTDNCKADNDQEITYQINLTYNGTGTADIEVSGKLPDGVNLSREALEKWSLFSRSFSQVVSGIASKETKRLFLTFQPDNKMDFWTNHSVLATLKPNLASSDTCLAQYAPTIAKNPDKANFGDPKCDFSNNDLYKMLKQQDPENADFWYTKVVPCESNYNPNEYYRCDSNGNNCTPDPAGAWGLFQMGRGKNGPFDRGDVIWQDQISNAINYNKTKLQPSGRSLGSYWACAQ